MSGFLPSPTVLAVGRASSWSIDRPEPGRGLCGLDLRRDAPNDPETMFALCGLANLGCLALLLLGTVTSLCVFLPAVYGGVPDTLKHPISQQLNHLLTMIPTLTVILGP